MTPDCGCEHLTLPSAGAGPGRRGCGSGGVVRRPPPRWLLAAILTAAGLAGCGAGPAAPPTAASGTTTPAASASGTTTPAVSASGTTPPAASQPPGSAAVSAPAGVPAGVAMPNPALTPGETFAGVTTAQVCTSGYASSVRHVTLEQYHQVYASYGIPYPEPSGTYELDHLVPLELGGDNADANLWPQPAAPVPGFHQKDQLENTMHSLVCSGRLGLADAEQQIAVNWYAAYVRYLGG